MKELVFVPIAFALILGAAVELEALAEQSSDKAVKYSQDMVSAMDCAIEARPLTDCSPDLLGTQWYEEIAQTQAILQELEQARSAN